MSEKAEAGLYKSREPVQKECRQFVMIAMYSRQFIPIPPTDVVKGITQLVLQNF